MTKRDLASLARFGAFLEFTNDESEILAYEGMKCDKCDERSALLIPKKEVKERFREELKVSQRGIPNISPNLSHFWFFARCSKCGKEVLPMRS